MVVTDTGCDPAAPTGTGIMGSVAKIAMQITACRPEMPPA
jgi:hypothetical protein